ncbi:MAG: LPS export ABC transporter periplasmic protein LptC, partial [Candidatus Margulisiibacteriota bacterium]
MKLTRLVFLLLVIAFITYLFYWALFLPKEDVSQRIYKTMKEQERRADFFFKKVSFEEISEGIKYWQLSAQTAVVNKNTGIATLQNAEGTFFKKGRPTLKFRSPAALWDMKKKEIYLDKPVGYDLVLERKISTLLKTAKTQPLSIFNLPQLYKKELGFWFQARNLSWKLSDQKLLCSGGILVNKGEIAGYAEELEADVALEKILLKGHPKIMLAVEKSMPITLEADTFEIIGDQDLLWAKGTPKISWSEAEIISNQIEYRQAQKIIDLQKQVKIKYKDIWAWSDSARYLVEKQEIELKGNASAKQGAN